MYTDPFFLRTFTYKHTQVLLTSHLGRPKGKDDKYSLAPVADRLTELLGKKVTFVNDCIGDVVSTAVGKMADGDVALLENGKSFTHHKTNESNIEGGIYVGFTHFLSTALVSTQ